MLVLWCTSITVSLLFTLEVDAAGISLPKPFETKFVPRFEGVADVLQREKERMQ